MDAPRLNRPPEFVQAAERLGVDCLWSAEAWGQGAITSLAYLAGHTQRIHLGTGIMQISARAPAMTDNRLSLHDLADGRLRLGLGVSGPQVTDAHFARPEAGAQSVERSLADINVAVSGAIGDNVEELIQSRKPGLAFNMGAMGSATTNFYNDVLQRAGYTEDAKAIQALWIEGKREEAVRRVPDAMVTEFQAVGTQDMVRKRLQKYQSAGVASLNLRLDAAKTAQERLALLENILTLCATFSQRL